jgi:hypothetical protein
MTNRQSSRVQVDPDMSRTVPARVVEQASAQLLPEGRCAVCGTSAGNGPVRLQLEAAERMLIFTQTHLDCQPDAKSARRTRHQMVATRIGLSHGGEADEHLVVVLNPSIDEAVFIPGPGGHGIRLWENLETLRWSGVGLVPAATGVLSEELALGCRADRVRDRLNVIAPWQTWGCPYSGTSTELTEIILCVSLDVSAVAIAAGQVRFMEVVASRQTLVGKIPLRLAA